MRPFRVDFHNILTPEGAHVYDPGGINSPISHYAHGGTICPNMPFMPLAAQFSQYYLFRVCTGKYSIPDNSFRWASFKEGHPYK